MKIKFMARTTALLLLCAVTVGCVQQNIPSSPSPTVQATQTSSPTQEPASPTSQPTQEPATLLGEPLAPTDEYGLRTYQWEQQNVNDWLGDFPGSNEIRLAILNRISDTRMLEEYYSLFIGRPTLVDDGVIVPAGKRHDGEWMPELLLIENNEQGYEIRYVSQSDAWIFTHSAFPTSTGEIRTMFGVPELYGRENRPIRLTVTYDDGSIFEDVLPPGYGYLLATVATTAEVVDMKAIYEEDGEPVEWGGFGGAYDWRNTQGQQKQAALRLNMSLWPAYTPSTDAYDNWNEMIPTLTRIVPSSSIFGMGGTIFQCDLAPGEERIQYYPPMSAQDAYIRVRHWSKPLKLQKDEASFAIDGKQWGKPLSVRATLYAKDGDQELLPDEEGVIHTGEISGDNLYLLFVEAEFADGNSCSWVVMMGNSEA